jgi:hypothetical protein
MPEAPVRADINMAFNAVRQVATEVALDSVRLIYNPPQTDNFFICQRIRFLTGLNSSIGKNFQGRCPANPIDVRETDFNAFISRQLNTSNARHLALSLGSLVSATVGNDLYPCRCL